MQKLGEAFGPHGFLFLDRPAGETYPQALAAWLSPRAVPCPRPFENPAADWQAAMGEAWQQTSLIAPVWQAGPLGDDPTAPQPAGVLRMAAADQRTAKALQA
jgi:hypothetical protein